MADSRPRVYNKLTFRAFGSGELKSKNSHTQTVNKFICPILSFTVLSRKQIYPLTSIITEAFLCYSITGFTPDSIRHKIISLVDNVSRHQIECMASAHEACYVNIHLQCKAIIKNTKPLFLYKNIHILTKWPLPWFWNIFMENYNLQLLISLFCVSKSLFCLNIRNHFLPTQLLWKND